MSDTIAITRQKESLLRLPTSMRPVDGHPDTQQPLTRCMSFHSTTDLVTVKVGLPHPPSRTLWNYDGDEPVYVRRLTDVEYSLLVDCYAADLHSWHKMKEFHLPGQTSTHGKFATDDGDWVEGEHDGGKWLWLRWMAEE